MYTVYYDDIWAVDSEANKICAKWKEDLSDLSEKVDKLIDTDSLRGLGANNIKTFFSEVHKTFIGSLLTAVVTYSTKLAQYFYGYVNEVDAGDKNQYGYRYNTIVSTEVSETGSIKRKLGNMIKRTDDLKTNANNIVKAVSDLVPNNIYLSSDKNLALSLKVVINMAVGQSTTVENYESQHLNDLDEVKSILKELSSILASQASFKRKPITAYKSGGIGKMCNLSSLYYNTVKCANDTMEISQTAEYQEAMNLAFDRDNAIHEEEKESREWVKWVATGVAVVGSVTLIVVTAGAATPLVCAGVGAATGIATAAASGLADQYYEHGDLTTDMDWSKFGKDCLVGGVTGAVTGYFGAANAAHSAIEQPIKVATRAAGQKAIEKVAGGAAGTLWDVGDAVISGKSSDEVMSVLKADVYETIKTTATESAGAFAGGFVTGKFKVNTDEKGYLRTLGESTLNNLAEEGTKTGVNTIFELGECVLDPESSKSMTTVLKENGEKFITEFSKAEFKSMSEDLFSTKVDDVIGDIKNKSVKFGVGLAADVVESFADNSSEGIGRQVAEYYFTDPSERGAFIDFEELWEEDLDGGRKAFKDNHFAKNVGGRIDEIRYDEDKKLRDNEKLRIKLKKLDDNKDGEIEVVTFDGIKRYGILKEDYDAAVSVAGKGAYKDKTVNEILGINSKIDIEKVEVETYKISDLRKSAQKKKTNAEGILLP